MLRKLEQCVIVEDTATGVSEFQTMFRVPFWPVKSKKIIQWFHSHISFFFPFFSLPVSSKKHS